MPGHSQSPEPQVSRRVAKRYLLRDERIVVSTRWHWAKLMGPAAAVLVALFLTLWIAASTTDMAATGLALCVFGVVCAWAAWKVLEWRCEWFIATDRRLLKTYGLITQRVAMMPLVKVTDMSYDRTIMGRILGYGQFVMESAGQDQALSHIDYIPEPDDKYQAMCETIFGRDLRDPGEDEDLWEDDESDRDGHDGRHDAHRGGRGRDSRRERGRESQRRSQDNDWSDDWRDDEQRRSGHPGHARYAEVDPHELPADWDWVDEDDPRGRRTATRRKVAVDPDPTPLR